ncbi:hypothetical protein [uncultured Deinococcus sp.]|uniref:hypothetical protein n=1 Tax=uncultured Deinococcus sp. TaxID=158789 RepID=UPI0025EB6D0D|nr:hypothetical protein [uncultured Deinococcus sp.]
MTSPPPDPRRAPPRRRQSSIWPGILLALAVGGGGVWLVSSLAERPGAAPMDPAMPGMPGMSAPATPAGR